MKLNSFMFSLNPLNWFKTRTRNTDAETWADFDPRQRHYFEAGKLSRDTNSWVTTPMSGDPGDVAEIQRARQRALNLVANNPYAAKIPRYLCAKIIGPGLIPESTAIYPDGTIHEEFRKRAKLLWQHWSTNPTVYGKPGRGGMDFQAFSVLTLTETIVNGEILTHFKRITTDEANAKGHDVPLLLGAIEAERIVEYAYQRPTEGNGVFRGVILDENWNRVGYRLYSMNPWHPFVSFSAQGWQFEDYPASDFLHHFLKTRPSELRGYSWFTPLLLNAKHIDTFTYNEILASTIAAATSMVVTHTEGAGLRPSLNTPAQGQGADGDGNTITRFQPGQIWNAAPGDSVKVLESTRPNADAPEFLTFMLRGMAGGVPVLKGPALHNDYRESSFSSERAATIDQDAEIDVIRGWFVNSFAKPIWEEFLQTAIMAGCFDDLDLPPMNEMSAANRQLLFGSDWRGPSTPSINPLVDVQASAMAVANGLSTIIQECQKRGENWQKNLDDMKQVLDYADKIGLPDQYKQQLMGAKAPMAIISDLNGDNVQAVTPDKEPPAPSKPVPQNTGAEDFGVQNPPSKLKAPFLG